MITKEDAVNDLREYRRNTGYKIQYCAQVIANRTGWSYSAILSAYNRKRNAAKPKKRKRPDRVEFFNMYGD